MDEVELAVVEEHDLQSSEATVGLLNRYISVPTVEYLKLLLTSQPDVRSERNWFFFDSSIDRVIVSLLMFCFAFVSVSQAYDECEVGLDVDVLVRLDEVADVFDEPRSQRQEGV